MSKIEELKEDDKQKVLGLLDTIFPAAKEQPMFLDETTGIFEPRFEDPPPYDSPSTYRMETVVYGKSIGVWLEILKENQNKWLHISNQGWGNGNLNMYLREQGIEIRMHRNNGPLKGFYLRWRP